jgi:hypothetical protein
VIINIFKPHPAKPKKRNLLPGLSVVSVDHKLPLRYYSKFELIGKDITQRRKIAEGAEGGERGKERRILRMPSHVLGHQKQAYTD